MVILVCGLLQVLTLTINPVEEDLSLETQKFSSKDVNIYDELNRINNLVKAIGERETDMLKVIIELKMDVEVLKELLLNHFTLKEKSEEGHSFKSLFGNLSLLNDNLDSYNPYKIENDIAESIADIDKIPLNDSDFPEEEEDIVVIMAND